VSEGAKFPVEVLRDIEAQLSLPLFRGVPIGPTLGNICAIELYEGHGKWNLAARWKDRARRVKHFLRPAASGRDVSALPQGRILVTWMYNSSRINQLLLPTLRALGPQQCVVIGGAADVFSQVPAGAATISWDQALHFDTAAWRADYRKCRPAWQRCIRALCRKHALPRGAYDRLAFHILVASRSLAGCLEFLRTVRPPVVVTEYDRNDMWSCLVLAARTLGIPTFSLVHGVINDRAVTFVPVLADKIFCWGEIQRRQLLEAGEKRAEILIGGCPRLTRDLSVTPAEARRRLGLPVDNPVIMLGTTPVRAQDCRDMAELFCRATHAIGGVSAVVRLHAQEHLDTYSPVASRYPAVRFLMNREATLDEALAAADIVVVPNSGFGSDALVKGRLTIVLDLPGMRLGHGRELIEQAGCPRAANAEELAAAIKKLVTDASERARHLALAARYVTEFCAYFGQDSAQRIAAIVRESLPAGNGLPPACKEYRPETCSPAPRRVSNGG
jgi:glycosyltransferase involved in cell wall biosynthesis